MDDDVKKSFKTEDFIAFGCMLAVSCIVGIYFAYKDRKNSTMNSYFFGGGDVNFVAVGLSLAMTFQSAYGIIAYSAETYIVGDMMFIPCILNFVSSFLTAVYFVPAFHRLRIETLFEYIEMRFNKYIGRFAAIMRVLGTSFYMGFAIYLPAITLSAVAPISIEAGILLTSGFCVFYTALGGMKAVIWTDVLQAVVMMVGTLAICIQGLIDIGGFENLSSALKRGERNTLTKFDNGLITRISPLALFLSSMGATLNSTSFSQQSVQRFKSCKTIRTAQYAVITFAILFILINVLNTTNGLVMYAYFEGCDPVKSGEVQTVDQAVPYLVAELFKNLPGMVGIFVATVFSATLSTVSSGINSFAIVIVDDMLAPCSSKLAKSDRTKLILGKILIVVLGGFVTLIAFAASFTNSNILPLFTSFFGIIGGPISGLFYLGFFFPWANSTGAVAGLVSSIGFLSFLFIGSNFFKIPYPDDIPPRYVDQCPHFFHNFTTDSPDTTTYDLTTKILVERSVLQDFYNLNFNSTFFFGITIVVVVGLVASLIAGPNNPAKADPKLFIPVISGSCVPVRVRKFFRLGVPEIEDFTEEPKEKYIEDDKL